MSDSPGASGLDSTARLLDLIRDGDEDARNRLVARFLPLLQRWATGRLPAKARTMVDTNDLVQVTLLRALGRVEEFESKREGAFLAYLRQILLNQIKDQLRQVQRLPEHVEIKDGDPIAAEGVSPLEKVVGRDVLERYDRALERLSPDQSEAVILRLEMGYTYEEIAEATGSPSWNAARMKVKRALLQLAEVMDV